MVVITSKCVSMPLSALCHFSCGIDACQGNFRIKKLLFKTRSNLFKDQPSEIYFNEIDTKFKNICFENIHRDILYISILENVEIVPTFVAPDANEGKRKRWKCWFPLVWRRYFFNRCVNLAYISLHIFTPQPLRAPGYCCRPSGRAGGRQGRQAPLTLSGPQFFTDHFQTWQGHLLPQGLGHVRSWRFCLTKYAHNRPFNE